MKLISRKTKTQLINMISVDKNTVEIICNPSCSHRPALSNSNLILIPIPSRISFVI